MKRLAKQLSGGGRRPRDGAAPRRASPPAPSRLGGVLAQKLSRSPALLASQNTDLRIAQRLHRALTGGCERRKVGQLSAILSSAGDARNRYASDQLRCSRVREGEYINTDVTAPGAILALGLHFLQTNSAAAAARLYLPDTHVLLDNVRPDLLLLRVVARGLILWDSLRPSIAWVEAQLPRVVLGSMRALKLSAYLPASSGVVVVHHYSLRTGT